MKGEAQTPSMTPDRLDGWMSGQMDGETNEMMHGPMDEWMMCFHDIQSSQGLVALKT